MSGPERDGELPVHAIRTSFLDTLGARPIVVSSPTGSGKSTEIPRWCQGRSSPGARPEVLVVEPRRVACRTLAARVAELEGTRLGDGVGYVVRDDALRHDGTKVVFATPGIVLRNADLLRGAGTVILDEFHERTLDVDLLLALLLAEGRRALCVMSATLDGERVAAHVGGVHLTATGRTFPVDVRYLGRGDALPHADDLPARVRGAVATATDDPGDILVFLPGKAEIEVVRRGLDTTGLRVVVLHGGLTLDAQRSAFERSQQRKVILATNVAETSVTIPGVGVVVDVGLVRQTRYQDGRASLVLAPIAEDAAAQRAGRAGRMAAGVCYRLWSAAARLAPSTPPEIHRQSLVPLVLSASAWGRRPETLPLLDPPRPQALEAARADLAAWGALDAGGVLTDAGREVFALPLEPFLARLLVASRGERCLQDAVDLVAALAAGRPIFEPARPPAYAEDDLRLAGCDATALVRAVRIGRANPHGVSAFAVTEARQIAKRLRAQERLPPVDDDPPVDRDGLVRAAMQADARAVHVARPRGRDVMFANGGTELELARESAVRNLRQVDALIVLEARAFGEGRAARRLVTCAMAVPLAVLAGAGLGDERVAAVTLERGQVMATVERVLAGRVLTTREEEPRGDLARQAIATLFLRGSIFKDALRTTKQRLDRTRLAAQLAVRGHAAGVASTQAVPDLESWVAQRLHALGVEAGGDLAMLSPADLTLPDLPFESRSLLDREFPLTVDVGDARYEALYDLDASRVVLRRTRGTRETPPPLAYLPRFSGLRICIDGPRGIQVLR